MKLSLRALRINSKLSIKESAGKLGVSVDTLRNYETGKKIPRVDIALAAADLYGCGINDIDFLLPSYSG